MNTNANTATQRPKISRKFAFNSFRVVVCYRHRHRHRRRLQRQHQRIIAFAAVLRPVHDVARHTRNTTRAAGSSFCRRRCWCCHYRVIVYRLPLALPLSRCRRRGICHSVF